MKKFFLFYLLLMSATQTFSQSTKDTLFFNNGSIVIGEIKKIKLGVITFDPDDANDITVQIRKLKSISAVSKIFRIETIRHTVYFGKLIPHSISNYARLIRGNDTSMLYLQDISVLYPFERSFAQRFSGNVGLGYSYTRSSGFGRLNFDGALNYVSEKREISLAASGIYTMTDTSFTRDNENISLLINNYFSPTSFTTLIGNYQRNLELGLQRRYQEGFGVGNKFITSKHVYAWTRGGLVLNQEKSTEGNFSGTLSELFGQVQFNFFRFTKPEIHFDLTESFYYSLSESGRFRNDGSTNLKWEIIEDLDLSLNFYSNYDSKPPGEEGKNFDFGVTFGVSYSF
jgi:Protein of unknown function, DUF481